jgi:probable rRNA maturation factor
MSEFMNTIEVQTVVEQDNLPTQAQFQHWVDAALSDFSEDTEIVIRIVDELESAELNERYRHKQGATNILSFPADLPEGVELNLLGDLVVCAPVLAREATEQAKVLHEHWAHIIIHGVLHLLGYDHIDEEEAEFMEEKEIAILDKLAIANPYIQSEAP